MRQIGLFRGSLISAVIAAGMCWNLYTAYSQPNPEEDYPNTQFVATPVWLTRHADDKDVIVVDVRTDEYYDGKVIPNAIRLPWNKFRFDDLTNSLASVFAGVREAERLLGEHGIARSDTVVLYDSVERDGGATASYVFWVLDVLGHEDKRVLNGGIDAWIAAGGDTGDTPAERQPVLYQAPYEELDLRRLATGKTVYARLNDPYYQIIDVRSQEEYLGEKGTKGLTGKPLKLGHIPTAYNVNYEKAWIDQESKELKSYSALRELFRGLNPEYCTIVYCNSGRRSSYAYYVLRVMGFGDVRTYEASWKEWGRPSAFFPVETEENQLRGGLPTGTNDSVRSVQPATSDAADVADSKKSMNKSNNGTEPSGGYVSCGG